MFSYKFIVRTSKNNTLRLRITNNRKSAEFSLGLKISEEDLMDALSLNPKPINAKWSSVLYMYRTKLDEIKCDLLKSGNRNCDVTVLKELVMSKLLNNDGVSTSKGKKKGNFLPYYCKFADMHQNKRTREIYMATVSRMKAFSENLSELDFEDITVEWLIEFDKFLSKTAPKKNSRNIHFRNIRAVMKDAFAADLTTAHPFDRFKHTGEKTRKRSFSVQTIRKIFNAEVKPWQQKYLDFFKLSFMLIGINVIDLCNATELQDGRLDYVRAKTNKLYSVKVEPEAMEIINKYRGETKLLSMVERSSDYRHFYAHLCKGLKGVRENLGLKELTTYWARHSWATIAYEIGVSHDIIRQALGHGNNDVTSVYIRLDEKKVDEANRRVLDYVLYDIS